MTDRTIFTLRDVTFEGIPISDVTVKIFTTTAADVLGIKLWTGLGGDDVDAILPVEGRARRVHGPGRSPRSRQARDDQWRADDAVAALGAWPADRDPPGRGRAPARRRLTTQRDSPTNNALPAMWKGVVLSAGCGEPGETRTPNQLIKSQLLCH